MARLIVLLRSAKDLKEVKFSCFHPELFRLPKRAGFLTRRMKNDRELSVCCNASVLWTSYNLDRNRSGRLVFPKNEGKKDHHTCSKCLRACNVVNQFGQIFLNGNYADWRQENGTNRSI